MPSATMPNWHRGPLGLRPYSTTTCPIPLVMIATPPSCDQGHARFNTVESVRSRCNRLIGNFSAKRNTALDTPQLPSAFSKSMGFTLGIALPHLAALIFCLKYSWLMYVQTSLHKSIKITWTRRTVSHHSASPS